MEPMPQTAEPRYTGRPSKNDSFKLYDGDLYKVLLKNLPTKYIKGGRIDTQALCLDTGNARFTVYRWLNEQRLSKKAIKALLKLSAETPESRKRGKLTRADLLPFFDLGDL